jgi:hypothetical protein
MMRDFVRPEPGRARKLADPRPLAKRNLGEFSKRRQFLEWIELLEARATEGVLVARGDSESVFAGGRGNIAIFHRHAFSQILKHFPLIRPHLRHPNIESVDPSPQGRDQSRQPGLQLRPLPALLGPHPIRGLGNDHRAGVPSDSTPQRRIMPMTSGPTRWLASPRERQLSIRRGPGDRRRTLRVRGGRQRLHRNQGDRCGGPRPNPRNTRLAG